MPGLCRRLPSLGLAAGQMAPGCRCRTWEAREEKPCLYPELCPSQPLTPAQLCAGTAGSQPVALDGTVRTGNTLYSRYRKPSKRMKLKCRRVRLREEQGK